MTFIPPTVRVFTATAVGQLDITGLDLNTELMYEIFFKTTKAAAPQNLGVKFNNDSGLDYSFNCFASDPAGALLTGFQAGTSGIAVINTGLGAQTYRSWAGRILLALQADGRPIVTMNVVGVDDGTPTNIINVHSSGFKNWTTNVTSLNLFLAIGSCDWVAKVKPIKFY